MTRALVALLALATSALATTYSSAVIVRNVTTTTIASSTSSSSSTTSTSTSSTTDPSATTSTSSTTTTSTSSSTTTTTAPANPQQLLAGGDTSAPPNNTTSWNAVPAVETWATNETFRHSLVAAGGSASHLRVDVATAPGSGKSWTYTLRKNGSSSGSPSCVIADLATFCEDFSTTLSYAAGDRWTLQAAPSGTPTASNVRYSARWTPTTADEFLVSSSLVGLDGPLFIFPFGAYGGGDEATTTIVMPIAGTLKNLHAYCPSNVAGGASRTFTARKNGVDDGTVACTMSAGTNTCNDTSGSVSFAAGDLFVWNYTRSGSPGADHCALGAVFDPTTADRFILAANGAGNVTPATGTKFGAPVGASASRFGTSEDSVTQQVMQGISIVALSVDMTFSPGSGNTLTYTTRKNGGDETAIQCAVVDTATTCNDTSGSVSFATGDLLSTEITESGGTAPTRHPRISYGATLP